MINSFHISSIDHSRRILIILRCRLWRLTYARQIVFIHSALIIWVVHCRAYLFHLLNLIHLNSLIYNLLYLLFSLFDLVTDSGYLCALSLIGTH